MRNDSKTCLNILDWTTVLITFLFCLFSYEHFISLTMPLSFSVVFRKWWWECTCLESWKQEADCSTKREWYITCFFPGDFWGWKKFAYGWKRRGEENWILFHTTYNFHVLIYNVLGHLPLGVFYFKIESLGLDQWLSAYKFTLLIIISLCKI